MIDYKNVLDELMVKRDGLRAELDHVESAIEAMSALAKNSSGQAGLFPAPPKPSVGPYTTMSLKDATVKAVESLAGTPTTQQVIGALESGGYVSKAQNFYTSVYSTLFRLAENNGPSPQFEIPIANFGLCRCHRTVPEIVPASSQNRASGANSSQVGRSRK